MHIGSSNGVGVELRVLTIIRCAGGVDSAIDDDVSHMDALWCELAGQALRKATQRELAHRERGGLRESLDAGRSASKKHCSVPLGEHPAHGVLGNAKGGHRGDIDSACDLFGVDLDERSANAAAGVVDNDVGCATECLRGCIEQRADSGHVARIGHERDCAGLGGDRIELIASARSDRDPYSALARECARQARAKAGAGADDQRAAIRSGSHATPPSVLNSSSKNTALALFGNGW